MGRFQTALSAALFAASAICAGGSASYAMGLPSSGASAIVGAVAGSGQIEKIHYSHRRARRGHRHLRGHRFWRRNRMTRRWRAHRRWDRFVVRSHRRSWRHGRRF